MTKDARYYRNHRADRLLAATMWNQRNRQRRYLNDALRRIRKAKAEKMGRVAALQEELYG